MIAGLPSERHVAAHEFDRRSCRQCQRRGSALGGSGGEGGATSAGPGCKWLPRCSTKPLARVEQRERSQPCSQHAAPVGAPGLSSVTVCTAPWHHSSRSRSRSSSSSGATATAAAVPRACACAPTREQSRPRVAVHGATPRRRRRLRCSSGTHTGGARPHHTAAGRRRHSRRGRPAAASLPRTWTWCSARTLP